MIHIACDTLKIKNITNDELGEGSVVFARTYTHAGEVIHDTVTIRFDEITPVVFEFQAPVV